MKKKCEEEAHTKYNEGMKNHEIEFKSIRRRKNIWNECTQSENFY